MQRPSFLFWLPVLLSGGLLFSCQKSASLADVRPEAQVAPLPAPDLPLSTISVPISIPVAALEERVNQELKGVLYEDNSLQDDNLMVKVTKAGPIKLGAQFSKLSMEVPLKIWAKGRWQWNACELCKSIQKTEETEFEVVVRTESRLQIQPDYTLKSYTTGDFQWGKQKPAFSMGPLKINLAPFIEPQLKAQIAPMLQQLDQELGKRVPLQQYLGLAWKELQTPVLLHQQYNAWLSIHPQAVRLTPLELQQNQLRLQVGVDAFIRITTGQKPEAVKTSALPSFIPARTLPPQAQLAIASDVSYAYLTQMLQKELENQTFSFEEGKHQLSVHSLDVSGKGTQLLLALDVSGQSKAAFVKKKFQGKVWLQATPVYDATTQSIKVKDLQFSIQTRDQLVNTAQWLLHNKVRTQLEQQMVVPVKSQLALLRESLQAGLKEQELQKGIWLRGTNFTIAPDTLLITPTGLRAQFLATGQLSVLFQ
ncbi:DUF4403 family protein [Rufibacter immobilis]|uniref:DUF4403 family protein n=1 Tax=Rufibacter immobilis TaxID=1348778 RepID=UPI0035ED4925